MASSGEELSKKRTIHEFQWPSYRHCGSIPVFLQKEFGVLRQQHQFFTELRKSKELIQRLILDDTLKFHTGCVNTLDWSSDGHCLLTGSDDLHLAVWDMSSQEPTPYSFKTNHPNNIFSAKFLQGCSNREFVSSSGDGLVIHSQLRESQSVAQHLYKCHTGTTYKVLPLLDDASCFMSCSEDSTVRLFDVRQQLTECDRSTCCTHSLLVNMEKTVSSLALNSARQYEFAVGCADSTITFYDRRNMKSTLNKIRCQTTKNMPRRITSLQYDITGTLMLANVLCEKIQLLDLHVDNQIRDGNAKKLEDPKELFPTEPMPVKRLRLRGDWTDTGPQSRPGQRPTAAASGSSRFMVEISDLMTTWMRSQMSGGESSEHPRQPLIGTTNRTGEGGRNDSAIEDLLSTAANRTRLPPVDLIALKPILEYSGHRSSRTMIKESCFWDDSFVISGSDCGRIFIWNRHTGSLVNVMEGDKHVVNCIAPHPREFSMATSGIDHDVKIWRPTAPEATFDLENARSIEEINNQMLEETRDTVTVPALCVVQILRVMARGSQERENRNVRNGANSRSVALSQPPSAQEESDSEEE